MNRVSPFKFLDAYDKSDGAIFFGRDDEIEALYEMVYQSNLTLVYGRSGTGKTSLIQCGLANRFSTSDWLDIYVRRGDNINASLLGSLEKLKSARKEDRGSGLRDRLKKQRSGETSTTVVVEPKTEVNQVIETLNALYAQYFKPIYLIFDQFEELFILGDAHKEQPEFYNTIAQIQDQCGFCHVLFVLREEAIAQLYDFEKVVPDLFDKRLRVEPLSRANATNVVASTTAKFNIELEDEAVSQRIIDAITSGQGHAELTYLQVFLDALYQGVDTDKPVFTNAMVDELGGIGDVLADFLEGQTAEVQQGMEKQWQGVSPNAVRNVLSAFVTLEGTKQPLRLSKVFVPGLDATQVEYCVKELERSRIFRFSDDRYELSHDALAARVAETRSTADIAFLEAVKLIKDRAKAFKSTQTYLSPSELGFIHPFQNRLEHEAGLTTEQHLYIKESIRVERSRRRKRNRQIAVVGVLLTIGFFTSLTMWYATKEANFGRLIQMGDGAVLRNDYEAAFDAYSNALTTKPSSEIALSKQETAERMSGVYQQFTELLAAADSLTRLDTNRTYIDTYNSLIEANALLTSAVALEIGATALDDATNRKRAVENELKMISSDLERRADIMKRMEKDLGYEQALVLYEQAVKVNPNNALLNMKIDECKEQLQ